MKDGKLFLALFYLGLRKKRIEAFASRALRSSVQVRMMHNGIKIEKIKIGPPPKKKKKLIFYLKVNLSTNYYEYLNFQISVASRR